MARTKLKYLQMALLGTLVLVVSGCVIGKIHFVRSIQVSEYFEQQQLLPDHQYYYFGHQHGPDAVVGIRNGWTFQTASWKTMEPDADFLKDLVWRMHNTPGSEYNYDPNGAYIYNDNGETIGVWYSVWVLPILRFTGDRTFTISDPMPSLPNDYRDSDNGNFRSRRIKESKTWYAEHHR